MRLNQANSELTVWTLRVQKLQAFTIPDKATNWNQAYKPGNVALPARPAELQLLKPII